jgi:hypothetical protein
MMKLLALLAAMPLVFLTPSFVFSQANASLSGIVTDASQSMMPGVTVTATNNETGVVSTTLTNSAGVYNFPSLQVGVYKLSAELSGFQTQMFTDVKLGNAAQLRLNFTLQIRELQQSVEVSVQAENLILESSSSAGVVLPEKKITELPVVNSNVLSLLKVMGGVSMTDSPIFGANDTQFAGVSAVNINVQRDGVTVNDVRWNTGANSPVYLNPEMVGEFRMVLAPVDAELGRGNGQVQVTTRAGTNRFHGSAVWNNQNTFLDANEWWDNRQGTTRDWRNQNEYTLSLGGPVVKNKTFFFVSWDHQIARIRQNSVNPQVPTPCARKTIWRWFDGWSGGNVLTNTNVPANISPNSVAVTPTVNADGSPIQGLLQPNSALPAQLHYASVFGPLKKIPTTSDCSDVTIDSATGFPTSDWVDYTKPIDPLHVPDATGYVNRFMSLIPLPNNYQVGDGLNWGGYRWVRRLNGGDNVFGLGEMPNRRQINFRIDHNFNRSHRVSGTYSLERNNAEDSFPTLPENSYGGAVIRKPQSFSVNFTSTLRPTVLNEARVGLSRPTTFTTDPLFNPLNGDKLRNKLLDLWPNPAGGVPVVIGLGPGGNALACSPPTFAVCGGVNPWGSGRGNFSATWGGTDPRWSYADTLTWTRGRHSMKFGAEVQRTQSYEEWTGVVSFAAGASAIPSLRGQSATYSGFGANSGFHVSSGGLNVPSPVNLPGAPGSSSAGNVLSGIYNMLNIYAGAVGFVDQYRFINTPTALSFNDISKGEDTRIADYRQNQFSLFLKDDWKVTDSLTLNLGLRYEWYGVGYLKGGMSAGLKGGAMSIFGRSGRSFSDWMRPGTMNPDGSVTYNGTDAEIAFIGPGSPNPSQQLYNDDWNNFGPAVGFAWQLPWFGKGKTTMRGGYQLTYMPPGRVDSIMGALSFAGKTAYWNQFGLNSQTPYISLNNINSLVYEGKSLLPVVPIPSHIVTPAANPVLPVTQRSSSFTVYEPNLQAPYIQNLTMSVTRTLSPNVTLDVRYIGTLSRKLVSSFNLNSANIWNNGLKEAFDLARSGQESPLLDKLFAGINIAGIGFAPVGTTNSAGVLQTGAMHLRAFSGTSGNLANGNYLALANSLSTMNYVTTFPGNGGLPGVPVDTAGMVLRHNKFPENFIYTSPQFSSANWTGNLNHANYHSLQGQVTVRPTHGFSVSGTYTWSRNLGNLGYTDPRDRAADYGLLSAHRAHALTVNGTFELPFGRERWLLANSNGVVSRIVSGWQVSWITNFATGRPYSLTSQNMLYDNGAPNRVGDFDPKSGEVVWPHGSRTGSYFWDEQLGKPMYTHVPDPQCQSVTTTQNLRNSCSLRAVVTTASFDAAVAAGSPASPDASKYQYIFVNPFPTERGNFQRNSLTQVGTWSADMAMGKSIRITEGTSIQVRLDATNIFNHPLPSVGAGGSGVSRVRVPTNPTTQLTSSAGVFRELGYLDSKIGARTFQAKVRIDF